MEDKKQHENNVFLNGQWMSMDQWINALIFRPSMADGIGGKAWKSTHPFAGCSFRTMFQTQNWDGSGQRTFVVRHETPVFLEVEIALSG